MASEWCPMVHLTGFHPQKLGWLTNSENSGLVVEVLRLLRSCDLTACDYWLWGDLKRRVYHVPVTTIEELKDCILETINKIPDDVRQNAVANFARPFVTSMLW